MRYLSLAVVCACLLLFIPACGDDSGENGGGGDSSGGIHGEVNGQTWGYVDGSIIPAGDSMQLTLSDSEIGPCDSPDAKVASYLVATVPAEEGTYEVELMFVDRVSESFSDDEFVFGESVEVEITEMTDTRVSGTIKSYSVDEDNYLDQDVSFSLNWCGVDTPVRVNGQEWTYGGGGAIDENSEGSEISITLTDRQADACDGTSLVGFHISASVPAEEGSHETSLTYRESEGEEGFTSLTGTDAEVEITEITETSVSGEFKSHWQNVDNFLYEDMSFTVDRCQD